MKKFQLLLIVILLLGSMVAYSQDLDKTITQYQKNNATGYLQPLADAFGANLNSGLSRSAHISKFGLHIGLSLQAMYSPIPDDKKKFIPEGADFEVPTIFGSESNYNEYLDGLWDTDFFPLAVPQLTIGSLMGTEATVRYFAYENKEIGEIKLYGWGLRHSISQYIPLCPIDIAAGFFQQKFSIGSYVEANALYYGLQVSKKISVLMLYAGVGGEKSTLDLNYEFEDSGDKISFDLDGENKTRMTIGAGLDFKYIKLYADYHLAPQNVFSGGIGFGF
ncbi:MAG: DUF6588 family protein [bacterium]